jgi:hypothetical protein
MASELKPAKEIGMATVGLLSNKGKEADLRKFQIGFFQTSRNSKSSKPKNRDLLKHRI